MARKGQSKRVTLQQKYKIQKRVKEHKRKLKKAQKKNGITGSSLWRSKQEANIPNDWPFKDQMLADIERQRKIELENQEKNKQLRKLEAAKKKKLAAEGKSSAAQVESMLPASISTLPLKVTPNNAIILDAHQRKVWRDIRSVVEESDVVVEVLDVRDPIGSRCFELEMWIEQKLQSEEKAAVGGQNGKEKKGKGKASASSASSSVTSTKPIILLLNKCDLVPPRVVNEWLDFFSKQDHFPCLAWYSHKELDSSEKKGQVVSPKDLCPGAEALNTLLLNYQASADEEADAAGKERRPMRVGIVGFENVGKSSVLNTLARTHASGVGPIGGYTKELLRFKLGKGLYAVDTPGVPSKDEAMGPHITLPLSNTRILQDVGEFIQHFELENLLSVLNIQSGVEKLGEFLDGLAKRVGRQIKGGELNQIAGARKLFKDWNEGRLLYYTAVPEVDQNSGVQQATGPIVDFFVASNKKTLNELKKRKERPAESMYLEVEGSLFENEDDEEGEEGEDEDGDMMMDGEEDDGEEQEEDGEEDEDEEMMEDEEEEEEEEPEPVPQPKKKNGKQQPAPTPAPASKANGKKSAAAAPAPAPQAASASNKKQASKPAAAASPASKKAPTPAPAPAPAKQSRKRTQRDEEEAQEEEVVPAPKKRAAEPTKPTQTKPTPKAAQQSASQKKNKK